jgi:uncharacterized membrane protein
MALFGKQKQLIPSDVQERIVDCIRNAEQHTTGELRIFVESRCPEKDPMHRAHKIFVKMGMQKTERRNAVLVYLAMNDRKFAILGDKEIYEKAGGPTFWQQSADILLQYLKKNEIAEGLSACINELGRALATHFPYDPAVTKNELPDEIIFGK